MQLDAPYNFAPSSPLDPWLYGAERPGYELRGGTPRQAIERWIAHMHQAGVLRVICLLPLDERQRRYGGTLLSAYEAAFRVVTAAPIEDFGLPAPEVLDRALAAIEDARRSQETAVVHCAAGMGRTGLVLASWTRHAHGLSADDAIALIRESARSHQAYRHPLEARGAYEIIAAVAPRSAPAP